MSVVLGYRVTSGCEVGVNVEGVDGVRIRQSALDDCVSRCTVTKQSAGEQHTA